MLFVSVLGIQNRMNAKKMENEQMVPKSQVNGEEEERKRDKEQHS